MTQDLSSLLHVTPTALDLLFIVVCIGLLATELWVIPHKKENRLLSFSGESGTTPFFALHDELWRLLGLALAGLTFMNTIGLLLRTAEMSNLPWRKAFSAIPLVLSATHYGMTWFVSTTAVGVLWLGWWRIKRGVKKGTVSLFPEEESKLSPFLRPFLYVMMLAMACVVWSVSASSHAADWGDFTLPEWMGWLHIMAGSIWLGGIMAFALVIPKPSRGPTERARVLFAVYADRLSRLAGIALLLVLVTGAYNVWRQLDYFSDLWSSGYGRVILFKLMLVALMAAMGALSRYFNLPFLCHDAGVALPLRILRWLRPSWIPRKGDALVRQFQRRIVMDVWLALGVLICAALLGHTMPPRKHVDAVHHIMSSGFGSNKGTGKGMAELMNSSDWLSSTAQVMMTAMMIRGEFR